MTDYTPTTEEVRAGIAIFDPAALERFDRWFAPYKEALGAIERIKALHRRVTRWGNEDVSFSTEQYEDGEYEDAGYSRDSLQPFDVCEECARSDSRCPWGE